MYETMNIVISLVEQVLAVVFFSIIKWKYLHFE